MSAFPPLPLATRLATCRLEMHRGFALVATLAFALPSARGWLCGLKSYSFDPGSVKRVRSTLLAMSFSARIEPINVEELWPHLAGKQTCASEDAGKVSSVLSSVKLVVGVVPAIANPTPPNNDLSYRGYMHWPRSRKHTVAICTPLKNDQSSVGYSHRPRSHKDRYVGLFLSPANSSGQASSHRFLSAQQHQYFRSRPPFVPNTGLL